MIAQCMPLKFLKQFYFVFIFLLTPWQEYENKRNERSDVTILQLN